MTDDGTRRRFLARYGTWAIVAGAAEGLGAAFSQELAVRGVDLILIDRQGAPLAALAEGLRRGQGVEVVEVELDLSSPELLSTLAAAVGDRDVGLLIYNACSSTIGEFLETSLESKLQTLEVNCRAPVRLIGWLGPRLCARRRGGVLLISSMSGFQGTAMVTTYAASKAFLTVLGEALWWELGPRGVDVLVPVGGAIETPGFIASAPAERRRRALPMGPEAVAREALDNLGRGPTRVVGAFNRLAYALLGRLLPRRAAVQVFSRTTRALYQGSSK